MSALPAAAGFWTTLDKVLFLREVTLFRPVAGEDLAVLAQIVRPVQLPRGQVLFAADEPNDTMFIVVQGTVELTAAARPPRQIGPMGCLGAMALLDSVVSTTTATTLSASHLLSITRDEFAYVLDDSPAIARSIIAVLTRRLREVDTL